MRLDGKTRLHRVTRGVSLYFRGIDIEFSSPDQPCLLALLDNLLEEATKHLHAIAFTDTSEAGMIWQGLVQIVAHIPPHAQPISRMTHQQAFRTNIFKEHDELELKKHDRINGGTPLDGIGLLHELAHKRE